MIIEEVYDALREAGASKEKSRAAAKAIVHYEYSTAEITKRLDRQESALESITSGTIRHDKELAILKSMVGFNLAVSVAILFRVFS